MINFKLYFEKLKQYSIDNMDAWADDVIDVLTLIKNKDPDVASLNTQTKVANYLNDMLPAGSQRGEMDQRLMSFMERHPKVVGALGDGIQRMPWIARTTVRRKSDEEILAKYGRTFLEGGGANFKGKRVQGRVRDLDVRHVALNDNKRDNKVHTCVMCGLQPIKEYNFNEKQAKRALYAHHLIPIRLGARETYVKEDIQILCGNCHVIADAVALEKYKNVEGDELPSADDSSLQVPAVQ